MVETTGRYDHTWFDRAGNYHTYQLKVTERYDLVSEDVIMYSATMEDPRSSNDLDDQLADLSPFGGGL